MRVPRHRAQGLRRPRRRLYVVLTASLAIAAAVLGSRYLLDAGSGRSATGVLAHLSRAGASCSAASGAACAPAPIRQSVGLAVASFGHADADAGRRQEAVTPASAAVAGQQGALARSLHDRIVGSPQRRRQRPRADQQGQGAGRPAGLHHLAGLDVSSGKHNQLMASGCGLSHQCPGEPSLGDRETAAGVHWTAAGENIGEGGPVAGTTAAIIQMAQTLTQDMLNEKPPDDGHRQNLLSSTFTHIGIAIYRGSDGTVWMTQDFSN